MCWLLLVLVFIAGFKIRLSFFTKKNKSATLILKELVKQQLILESWPHDKMQADEQAQEYIDAWDKAKEFVSKIK